MKIVVGTAARAVFLFGLICLAATGAMVTGPH